MERPLAKRYILYIRRSQDAEDRQMASLEDQEKEMMDFADKQGLNVVEVLRESKSAKTPGRPVFNEMLTKIHNGEADGILCWKINRLARNPVDGGQIQWMLQGGIISHIQTNGRDYKPTDNVIMMAVELGMANQFVNDLSVDVKRGMRNKAERGWFPQRSVPVGYKHNKGYAMGEPEIVTTEDMVLVKKLFKEMLTGTYSVPDIAKLGTRLGLVNKKGKPFCYNTYIKMLTSEFYCGYFYWKDADGNIVRHKGKHEAVLSEDEYNHIQHLLGKRGRPTRTNSYDFMYRGPLSCGECGCAITVDYQLQCICTECKNKFSMKRIKACPSCETEIENMSNPSIIEKKYYRCTRKSKTHKCKQGSIEEKELTKMVVAEIDKVSIDEDFYKWAVEALKEVHADEMSEQNQIGVKLARQTKELRDRADRLIMMRADGELSSEQFKRLSEETEKALREAEKEEQSLNSRTIDWLSVAEDYLSFSANVKKVFTNADNQTKREILQSLGLNLEIVDKKLSIIMHKPLLGIKNTYNKTYKDLGRFEPKKALDKQELSKEKQQAFSSLCAGEDSNF